MKKVLSIDIGTTSTKAAIIDEAGNCLALQSQEYELIMPQPGWVEAEPEVYWEKLAATIGRILSQAAVAPKEVSALAFCSQGQTFLALDEYGQPLGRAMVWLDTRASDQAQRIQAEFGRLHYYRHTGYPVCLPSLTASMLLWLKEQKPDIFTKAARFVMIRDLLAFRACGRAVVDESGAVSSGMYDIGQRRWWPELLEWIGLSPEQLSTVVPSRRIIGELTTQAADFLGLAPGTPIVSGAWDQLAAALGSGNIEPGILTETTGTALAVVATTDSLVLDEQARLLTIPHVLDQKGVLLSCAPTSGILLKWFRDELCTAGTSYADLIRAAGEVPPGARGLFFLPHFAGTGSPDFNSKVRGAILGLQLGHRRADIVRALLESLAFLLQDGVIIIKNLGVQPRTIRMLGGGARNQLLCQIKADVLGIETQTMAFPEAALMGAAMLAFVAVGQVPNLKEAATKMIRIGQTFTPNPLHQSCYAQVYQGYRDFTRRICRANNGDAP